MIPAQIKRLHRQEQYAKSRLHSDSASICRRALILTMAVHHRWEVVLQEAIRPYREDG